jgi:hypothetical protein
MKPLVRISGQQCSKGIIKKNKAIGYGVTYGEDDLKNLKSKDKAHGSCFPVAVTVLYYSICAFLTLC